MLRFTGTGANYLKVGTAIKGQEKIFSVKIQCKGRFPLTSQQSGDAMN